MPPYFFFKLYSNLYNLTENTINNIIYKKYMKTASQSKIEHFYTSIMSPLALNKLIKIVIKRHKKLMHCFLNYP